MSHTSIVASIPDPQQVRKRLATLLREARILRAVLRLGERAEVEPKNRQAGTEATVYREIVDASAAFDAQFPMLRHGKEGK
jgi:hypothetical protein